MRSTLKRTLLPSLPRATRVLSNARRRTANSVRAQVSAWHRPSGTVCQCATCANRWRNPARIRARTRARDNRRETVSHCPKCLTCSVTRLEYDAADRLSVSIDAENRRVRKVYDLAGQVLQELRADASPLAQVYAEYGYTANGRQAFVKDAKGNQTSAEAGSAVGPGSHEGGSLARSSVAHSARDKIADCRRVLDNAPMRDQHAKSLRADVAAQSVLGVHRTTNDPAVVCTEANPCAALRPVGEPVNGRVGIEQRLREVIFDNLLSVFRARSNVCAINFILCGRCAGR